MTTQPIWKNNQFWEHVEELRKTLIRSLIAIFCLSALAFYYSDFLFTFFAKAPNQQSPIIIDPLEGIRSSLKLSFFAGVVMASPIWGYWILLFILPALKEKELSTFLFFLFLALFFGTSGALFGYCFALPFANEFLWSYNSTLGTNAWTLSHTLNFSLFVFFSSVLSFELIALLFALVHLGKVKKETLKKGRKGAIVVIFLLSAIITPPDVATQIFAAIPMLVGYEACLLYATIRARGSRKMLAVRGEL